MTKLDSKAAYRVLRNAARPRLTELGFKSASGGRAWLRRLDSEYDIELDFQVDRYGFSPWGSQLTVNLLVRPREGSRLKADCRFHEILSDSERGELLRIQNAVIARIPKPETPPNDWEECEEGEWDSRFAPETYAGGDVWLRYYAEADLVEWWTRFLEPRLDRMLRHVLDLAGYGVR